MGYEGAFYFLCQLKRNGIIVSRNSNSKAILGANCILRNVKLSQNLEFVTSKKANYILFEIFKVDSKVIWALKFHLYQLNAYKLIFRKTGTMLWKMMA